MAGVGPNRRPVNMVFQHLALFPMMTVGENVGYGLARRGMARAAIRDRVARMLGRVGLAGAQDKRPDQLSGGQKQRVAIARSLVLEPTLLLLDEPLGALDLKLREHMKIELKQLQADFGTTFVYITHDQSEALVLSDRVAVMNAGRFEQVGAPQALYEEPRTAFVAAFVGNSNRLAGRALVASSGATAPTVAAPATRPVPVEVRGADPATGFLIMARAIDPLAAGAPVALFLRPEAIHVQRADGEQARAGARLEATVASVLFDGANSALLVRERATGVELRVAVPPAARLDALAVGTPVVLTVDAERTLAYADGGALGAGGR
jgi:spermidine/putrescine transport system ATP-binding protein